jgi:hypothetical protein
MQLVGFPWRADSCPTDSVLTLAFTSHEAMNATGRQLWASQLSGIAAAFAAFAEGSMSNVHAKERLQRILYSHYHPAYLQQLREHAFIGTEGTWRAIYNALQPPAQGSSLLLHTISVEATCVHPSCTNRVSWTVNESLQAIDILPTTRDDSQQEWSLAASVHKAYDAIRRAIRCTDCTANGRDCQLHIIHTTVNQPAIIIGLYPQFIGVHTPPPHISPTQAIGDDTYELLGASYGTGSHFTAEMWLNNQRHVYDGLEPGQRISARTGDVFYGATRGRHGQATVDSVVYVKQSLLAHPRTELHEGAARGASRGITNDQQSDSDNDDDYLHYDAISGKRSRRGAGRRVRKLSRHNSSDDTTSTNNDFNNNTSEAQPQQVQTLLPRRPRGSKGQSRNTHSHFRYR